MLHTTKIEKVYGITHKTIMSQQLSSKKAYTWDDYLYELITKLLIKQKSSNVLSIYGAVASYDILPGNSSGL